MPTLPFECRASCVGGLGGGAPIRAVQARARTRPLCRPKGRKQPSPVCRELWAEASLGINGANAPARGKRSARAGAAGLDLFQGHFRT